MSGGNTSNSVDTNFEYHSKILRSHLNCSLLDMVLQGNHLKMEQPCFREYNPPWPQFFEIFYLQPFYSTICLVFRYLWKYNFEKLDQFAKIMDFHRNYTCQIQICFFTNSKLRIDDFNEKSGEKKLKINMEWD